MTLNAAERAALAPLDTMADTMLDQVRAWAGINSGSRNLAGLAMMADTLAEAFGGLGAISRVEPAHVEEVNPAGDVVPVFLGRNLHLRVRPEAPIRVLLTGHMDTVFGADDPFQQSRWIDRTTLGGPGVADMKGGLAVMLAALHAFESSEFASGLGYEVIINSDEEVSSPGSIALLTEAAGRVQAALTYEPALPDGTLAGARKGSGNFSIVVRGRAAHAGRDPENGRNAIVAAADIAVRLSELRIDGLSVNPARIDGGGPGNVVPELAILRLNIRSENHDQQSQVLAKLRLIVMEAEARHDVSAHIHGGFNRPAKPMDAQQKGLFNLVRVCGSDIGLAISWRNTGGVCDGNNLAACGVPVVDTMGVRGGAIHTPDEFLCVDSLVERARLSTLLLMRLAQGHLKTAA